jgi:hypothetical protein
VYVCRLLIMKFTIQIERDVRKSCKVACESMGRRRAHLGMCWFVFSEFLYIRIWVP